MASLRNLERCSSNVWSSEHIQYCYLPENPECILTVSKKLNKSFLNMRCECKRNNRLRGSSKKFQFLVMIKTKPKGLCQDGFDKGNPSFASLNATNFAQIGCIFIAC